MTKSSTAAEVTLEEQELQLRLERAQKTPFRIKLLEEKGTNFPFINYEVLGAALVRYTVEIRSLEEKINSCSCPDYKINTFSTCKHIEGVLNFLKKDGDLPLPNAASPRVEIFLHPRTEKPFLYWPGPEDLFSDLRLWLSPYTSADQTGLIDPIRGVLALQKALQKQETPPEITSKIRLSEHLIEWAVQQKLIQDRENDKKLFLADVKAGKRSLQMLLSPLLPYQEEGMLHLAFQGRAILADEMGLGKTIQAIAASELLRRLGRVNRVLPNVQLEKMT